MPSLSNSDGKQAIHPCKCKLGERGMMVSQSADQTRWRIFCRYCGNHGPVRATRELAEQAWNRRLGQWDRIKLFGTE